jgi:hypothetical protein
MTKADGCFVIYLRTRYKLQMYLTFRDETINSVLEGIWKDVLNSVV